MPNSQFTIKLGVNSSGVTSGINSAVGQFQRLATTAQGLVQGFVALAAVRWGVNLIRSSIEFGSTIEDNSLKAGILAEDLQALSHGLELSGGNIDDAVKGMKNLSIAQIDAIKGNKELRATFLRYGITLDDLKKNDPLSTFNKASAGIGAATPSAQVAKDVQDLFGKAGQNLLPAMRNGLAAATEEAKKLGLVLRDDLVGELDRAGDEIDILTKKWKVFSAGVVATALQKFRTIPEIIGNFLGAGMLGAILKRAGVPESLAGEFARSDFKTREQTDAQRELDAALQRKKRRGEAPNPDDTKEGEREAKLKPRHESNINALQQIGARVSLPANIAIPQRHFAEAQKQTVLLNKISADIAAQKAADQIIADTFRRGGTQY